MYITVKYNVIGYENRDHFMQLTVHNFKAVIATGLKPGMMILQTH